MATSGSLVTRKYSNFKGLDCREGEISLNRSPDALNMYRNYKSSNILETRPDTDLLLSFDESVFGFFFYEVGATNQLIVHSGTKLYKASDNLTKSDDISIINMDYKDFTLSSPISDNTFEWRFDAVGLTYKFYIKFQTISSKKYMYIYRYVRVGDASATPDTYLWGVWEENNNKYTFIEDTEDIPSSIVSTHLLTEYKKEHYSWGHNLEQKNTSVTATLPNYVVKSYSKLIKQSGMKPAKSYFFVYRNILYIKDGLNYLQYDGTTLSNVSTYTPTTSISRTPAGGGTIYEDVNMLTPLRRNTFVGDGTSTAYHLDSTGNDNSSIVVKVNGSTLSNGYTYDYTNGVVTFDTAPSVPDTDGQDNVEITFSKTISGYADRILKCTLLCVFDNRVFFSGNQDYPNVVWHSSLDEPGYVSDLDYYNEGLDVAKVKALVPGNNVLWVFKEPSQANTTIFYHVPTIDAQYGKIYPNSHSGISTGCVSTGINFNDDICFFSDRGLEGISGDITTEQVVAHRSSFIDNKLLAETNYNNLICDEWDGYLLVFIGNKVYLADSRQVTAVNTSYEYDWYYWELDHSITCSGVKDGILYLGSTDGIYTLTNTTNDVENYWVTPKDTFGYGNYQKITNKRGCVIECEGADINVYASTNKDAIELIKSYTNVTDYITARIKKKKFKDIQLKISSEKNMKLESIMLEAYIGAYIKR